MCDKPYHKILSFTDFEEKGFFENIMGNGGNAGHQHFHIFQNVLKYLRHSSKFVVCKWFQIGRVLLFNEELSLYQTIPTSNGPV